MKIGIVNYSLHEVHASLVHVACSTAEALAREHDRQPYPPEYQFARPSRRRELLKEWMASCAVIVGSVDRDLFRAREELDRRTPYVCLLLGTLSRGAAWLANGHRYLRTSDILIANCDADVALAKNVVPNATVRHVPFPYDDAAYYPADQTARSAVRARLGIGRDEAIVVSAGRITLEKNLHTLLKTFRVVRSAVPHARLVIAGDECPQTFVELGTRALDLRRTLDRLLAHWHLDGAVTFVGRRDVETLRPLYSTADVFANLSLNHDENFGLVQIEAMACGLPAVGTTWGGLKDTIREGVTGALVPTVFTPTGVKVDWWDAAERIVELLAPTDRNRRLREGCASHVRAHYSMSHYARALDEVVRECAMLASRPAERLQPSPFAQRYWDICHGEHRGAEDDSTPPYRRGPEAWGLYRQLIAPFAGTARDEADCAPGGWCLPSPLGMPRDGTIAVNDPLYPVDVPVPPHLVRSVRRMISVFTEQAVLDDATLAADTPAVRETLAWMQAVGVLMRTRIGALDPSYARGALGQPVFVMREVDHTADIVYVV